MDERHLFENLDTLIAFLKDRSHSARIGSFLNGVVHNLNGSIQILSMQMEMIQKMVSGGQGKGHPSLKEKMDQCLVQIDKMRSLLEGLSLREEVDPSGQKVHLNEVIEKVLGLFHHHLFFKHQIKVKKNFSSRMPLLQAQEVDFREALSNLMDNAVEAMVETSRKELTLTTRAGLDHLQVVVADTGCGVPKELRPRLFMPFFTTKNGNHYGLGLFMTRKLLTPYGASIEPHFKEGETFFSIKIPLIPPSSKSRET